MIAFFDTLVHLERYYTEIEERGGTRDEWEIVGRTWEKVTYADGR